MFGTNNLSRCIAAAAVAARFRIILRFRGLFVSSAVCVRLTSRDRTRTNETLSMRWQLLDCAAWSGRHNDVNAKLAAQTVHTHTRTTQKKGWTQPGSAKSIRRRISNIEFRTKNAVPYNRVFRPFDLVFKTHIIHLGGHHFLWPHSKLRISKRNRIRNAITQRACVRMNE